VEESFNLQAVHDFIYFGPLDINSFDHLEFPGVVPRTFIGAGILALFTKPFTFLPWFTGTIHKLRVQILGRFLLGCAFVFAHSRFRKGIESQFGRPTSIATILLTIVQFHIPFWVTRTLPNTFALILVTYALGLWISRKPHRTQGLDPKMKLLIRILTFTCIVFRCDLVLFAIPILIQEFLNGNAKFILYIKEGIMTSLLSIFLTVSIDSYLWKRFIWPELDVLIFNTIMNKSHEWGTLPWHSYFTSFIPKIISIAFPFLIYAILFTSKRSRLLYYLIPCFIFISMYSFLPHKEWRFIIYTIPLLNMASGIGLSDLWLSYHSRNIRLRFLYRLAIIFCFLIAIVTTTISLMASIHNYPGGVALQRLHEIEKINPSISTSSSSSPTTITTTATNTGSMIEFNPDIHVHIDIPAAMTGISRFGEHSSTWIYSKNEFIKTSMEFWESNFTHLITSKPEFHGIDLTGYGKQWIMVEGIEGFDKISFSSEIDEIIKTIRNKNWTRLKSALIHYITSSKRMYPISIEKKLKIWIMKRRQSLK